MDYEPPRIEEIRKLTPEEIERFQRPVEKWFPYRSDWWKWLSRNSEVIVISSIIVISAVMIWIVA